VGQQKKELGRRQSGGKTNTEKTNSGRKLLFTKRVGRRKPKIKSSRREKKKKKKTTERKRRDIGGGGEDPNVRVMQTGGGGRDLPCPPKKKHSGRTNWDHTT